MKKFAFIFLILTLTGNVALAQKERILTHQGNEALQKGNIQKAREAYAKALEINPNYVEAQFNLGKTYQIESRALYEEAQNQPNESLQQAMLEQAAAASEKAAEAYEKLTGSVKTDEEINKLQYNLGNAQILSGQIGKSIEAYKEALRKDPTDEDARYNLAYAQHLLKQQEQQEQQQDNQDNQDQKQDQDQDQDQKPENEEQQEQQEQNQDNQQQDDQLTKEDAEKMLDALAKQEKDLQDKLNKKKTTAQPIRIEKNW